MSSLFESRVYALRRSMPFTRPTLLYLMKELAQMSCGRAVLCVEYRHAMASRVWWDLDWTEADGTKLHAAAQDLDLLGWRAIEKHRQHERHQDLEARPGHEHQDGSGI